MAWWLDGGAREEASGLVAGLTGGTSARAAAEYVGLESWGRWDAVSGGRERMGGERAWRRAGVKRGRETRRVRGGRSRWLHAAGYRLTLRKSERRISCHHPQPPCFS